MLKKLFISTLLVFCGSASWAQKAQEEVIDAKTLAIGATTSNYTNLLGGIVLRSSTPLSIKNNKTTYQYIALEFLALKNPRESSYFTGFGPKYTPGKKNFLISIRPQYGREFAVFQRSKENEIGLSIITAAGPSIGLLKPYYVKYQDNNTFVPYDPSINKNISGVGGIFKNGFKRISINPGLHAKLAANVDINTFSDNVTGLEIGTNVEYFFKEPEILASSFSDNPQTFVSVYLTLYFGNKKLIPVKKIKKSGNGIN